LDIHGNEWLYVLDLLCGVCDVDHQATPQKQGEHL
jgi:hypothetical protein